MVDYISSVQGSTGSLTVTLTDGETKTIPSTHPSYAEALQYLVTTPVEEHDEEHVRDLLHPARRLGRALREIDPLFGYDLRTLFYDSLPLTGPLADVIKQRLGEGGDWERFVRFASSLERNPSYTARQGLYSWVQANGLHILPDGRFVAHKGVAADGLSVSRGPNNFVDGVLLGQPGVATRVPHFVGSVVSKRRGDVDDSKAACATGLHVGTYTYANEFGGSDNRFLTVAVWPEDVVGGNQGFKIRVCRYEVIALNEKRADFEVGDYDVLDRSEEVTAFEVQHASEHPVRSRTHVWEEGQQEEYNSLPSVGRRLYDNLRTQFDKSHDAAFAQALGAFGTYEEYLAQRDAERAAEAAAAAEQAAAEAEVVEPVPMTETEVEQMLLSEMVTMDEKANASRALKRDLAKADLGHKPLARKWADAGVTEASVRRYRKAHGISLSFGTRVRDALT